MLEGCPIDAHCDEYQPWEPNSDVAGTGVSLVLDKDYPSVCIGDFSRKDYGRT